MAIHASMVENASTKRMVWNANVVKDTEAPYAKVKDCFHRRWKPIKCANDRVTTAKDSSCNRLLLKIFDDHPTTFNTIIDNFPKPSL